MNFLSLCPHPSEEESKVLPVFLSNKRAIIGLLHDLKDALYEEKKDRTTRLLQDSCPTDVMKYNAGFVSALTHVNALLDTKLEDIKQTE